MGFNQPKFVIMTFLSQINTWMESVKVLNMVIYQQSKKRDPMHDGAMIVLELGGMNKVILRVLEYQDRLMVINTSVVKVH